MIVKMTRPVTETVNLEAVSISILTKEQAETLPHEIVNDAYKGQHDGPGLWRLKGERLEGQPGILRFYVPDEHKIGESNIFENNQDIKAACIPHDIRPVLKVRNLAELKLSVGDRVTLGGVQWTMASDTLLLCNEDINDYTNPTHGIPYSSHIDDYLNIEDIADYEHSDIKRYVEAWGVEKGILYPDRSRDLKVYDVSVLTEDEASCLPSKTLRLKNIAYWLQMPESPKPRTQSYIINNSDWQKGFDTPIVCDGSIAGCEVDYDFCGVRPVLECQGDNLNPGYEFMYQGTSYKVCPFERNGHQMALAKDVIRDDNNEPIKIKFRDCKVNLGRGVAVAIDKSIRDCEESDSYEFSDYQETMDKLTKEYKEQILDRETVNAYEFSDLKKFLHEWAEKNKVINEMDMELPTSNKDELEL